MGANAKLSKSLVLLFAAVVVTVALAGASCRRGPQADDQTDQNSSENSQFLDGSQINNIETPGSTTNTAQPSTDTANSGLPNPTEIATLLQQEKSRAQEAIKALQDDVVLQLVSMKFINSLSNSTGLVTNYYIYTSALNPNFYYMVNVPRTGDRLKRFLMPTEDLELPFGLIPIEDKWWVLSYADALQEVEKRAGAAFRAKHPNFEASVILAKPVGSFTTWFITYRANDGSGEVLKATVDSYSGETTIL